MSSIAPSLPSFERPPIIEAVLSIQFAALRTFRSIHVGLLWNQLRHDYPNVLEQPPLDPVFETFGVPAPPTPMIRFEALLTPPMPRFWFQNEDGRHLFQLQQDRAIHNWRKQGDDDEYPRYRSVRTKFVEEIEKLGAFFRQNELGHIVPNQCEMTYLNFIRLPDSSNPHNQMWRITPFCLRFHSTEQDLPFQGATLENTGLNIRYIMSQTVNGEVRQFGRLYCTFSPAFSKIDQVPGIQLEITARGKPSEETVQSALDLLDLQHVAVVRTFAAVTTSELQEFWGRRDDS